MTNYGFIEMPITIYLGSFAGFICNVMVHALILNFEIQILVRAFLMMRLTYNFETDIYVMFENASLFRCSRSFAAVKLDQSVFTASRYTGWYTSYF